MEIFVIPEKTWEDKVPIPKIVFFISVMMLVVSATKIPFAEGGSAQLTVQGVGETSRVSKTNSENKSSLLEIDTEMVSCLQDCQRENQMAAVGFEVIRAQCQKECRFKKALSRAGSDIREERTEGIKTLCELADPRGVPLLIEALRRDMKERTGLWAWIIPGLGASRDTRAVPVLLETLNKLDDDWLGREMSAQALGDIGDQSATPALLRAVWRADTRDAAIIALAGMNDPRAIEALLSALQPEESPEAREAAMAGLQRLGTAAVPAMVEAFAEYFRESPQTQRRLWLCQLLGTSSDELAVQALGQSLNDPDPAVRQCAADQMKSGQ